MSLIEYLNNTNHQFELIDTYRNLHSVHIIFKSTWNTDNSHMLGYKINLKYKMVEII